MQKFKIFLLLILLVNSSLTWQASEKRKHDVPAPDDVEAPPRKKRRTNATLKKSSKKNINHSKEKPSIRKRRFELKHSNKPKKEKARSNSTNELCSRNKKSRKHRTNYQSKERSKSLSNNQYSSSDSDSEKEDDDVAPEKAFSILFKRENLDGFYDLIDDEKVSVNAQNPNDCNNSILHYIVTKYTLEDLKFFLRKYRNADLQIDKKNDQGVTALHEALFQAGVYEERAIGARYKRTAMEINDDLCNLFLSKAERLVKAGAGINKKSSSGDTALIYAVANDHEKVAKYILDNFLQVNVTIQDQKGYSAVEIAVLKGQESIVKKMLAHPSCDKDPLCIKQALDELDEVIRKEYPTERAYVKNIDLFKLYMRIRKLLDKKLKSLPPM